ncbi:MAG TPA: type I DNA topoisomerase [Pyrinomonadaceae bacterium]|jgi:DNA topoisomerase-1|nr:type I DNA topoisomerase [Pyrinomonadaceae bacterium]
MSKKLVIVESPAKAKTINKYLGSDYRVMASYGHIKDLPSKGLGVDVANDFEPTYEVIPETKKRNNKKTVAELKKAAKEAEAIYLAADPDREGEAICQHLAEEIVPKRPKTPSFRVMFNEITKRAVQEAFEHPKEIDKNLVDAQQARRVLDRLVGYKVSPLLCRTVGGKLSAGRVQSVALRMVVERERDIEKFVKTEYWTIAANLSSKLPPAFDARLWKIGEQTIKTGGFDQDVKKSEILIGTEAQAREIVAEAEREQFRVAEVATKERKRNPVPAFITSKLQQEAARKIGYSVKKTMMLAQKLYEGVEVGAEGSVGLITYMRTDSTRVSEAALAEARDFIGTQYGAAYLPEKAIHYRSKKDAQDAHEAIRPTDVSRTPESVEPFLNKEELKLYRLIWQRFVASQMMPALFDQTTIDIEAGRFLFRATGSVLKFDGFLRVYEEGRDEKSEEDEEAARKLPLVERGEQLKLNAVTPEQHFTEPPPRYTEATLVKALEEKGIGRPSTYAAIMTTILDREYVEKHEGRFHPTALGTTVNDLLVASFDDLFNESYTARMEEELDEIEDGKMKWTDALHEFYGKFAHDLKNAEAQMKAAKQQAIPTDEICENCGSGMVIKFGRFGQFLACSNYPECRTTREIAKPQAASADGAAAGSTATAGAEGASEAEEESCELCGKPMALKRGRFGQFLGCTGYPDCRNIRKISKSGAVAPAPVPLEGETCPLDGAQLVRRHGRFGEFVSCANYPACKYIKRETTGIACPRPGCKGEIVVKKSKRGKAFYGCSEYPKCDAVYWDKPVAEACPQCSAPFLLEKTTKKGTFRMCAKEECGYREDPVVEGAQPPVTGSSGAGRRVAR